jgi:hypothetical protein
MYNLLFTYSADNNRRLIAEEGGVYCVVNAMKRHKGDVDVQTGAVGALLSLSPDSEC